MLAGHCSSFPTEDSATILADAANGFVNSGTMTRASLWNYTAMADATTPDFEMTIARDWAMCAESASRSKHSVEEIPIGC